MTDSKAVNHAITKCETMIDWKLIAAHLRDRTWVAIFRYGGFVERMRGEGPAYTAENMRFHITDDLDSALATVASRHGLVVNVGDRQPDTQIIITKEGTAMTPTGDQIEHAAPIKTKKEWVIPPAQGEAEDFAKAAILETKYAIKRKESDPVNLAHLCEKLTRAMEGLAEYSGVEIWVLAAECHLCEELLSLWRIPDLLPEELP